MSLTVGDSGQRRYSCCSSSILSTSSNTLSSCEFLNKIQIQGEGSTVTRLGEGDMVTSWVEGDTVTSLESLHPTKHKDEKKYKKR